MYGGGGYDGGGGNANSLFSGGGFMPSQSTNAVEGSGGGGFPKSRNAQTLLPLTIKQIMDASQTNDDKSNFAVNGMEVSTVRLVGRMFNKVDRVTDVSFTLDDGTGRIHVNRWENDSTDTKEMNNINDGDYVIVNGGLKGFQGKRQVVAYSARPVTNFNDVTHHFLHCIHVHLELTRSKPQGKANTATGTPNQAMLRDGMAYNQGSLPNQASTFSAPQNTGSASDISKLVLSVFHDPTVMNDEHGISVDYVSKRLNLPEDAVRKIIQEEYEKGHLYATIDDHHYKSTMNGWHTRLAGVDLRSRLTTMAPWHGMSA
uniref:Replication protein A C-terminal domain-containing protein n=2 Tax=Leersia perrieri TaxID=77586 RepID=A0A0D9VIN1_9ORYZ